MNLNDLTYFLAVAREGQLLAAARRVGTSQATINRRIGSLEQSLGVKLFHRSTKGCELTEAGQNLLPYASRIEAEALSLPSAVQPSDVEASGTIRIGAPDGFGVSFLAPRLGALMEQHPNLRVQLVPIPRAFSLSQREADLAITIGRPERGRLRGKKLTDYSLGLFASHQYLQVRGEPKSVEGLKNHQLVGYVEDLIFTSQLDYTSEISSDWQSRIEISSALGQLQAVRASGGIGLLHRFMASAEPDLVPILPQVQIRRSYWIVWHESLRNSRRVRAVVDFLDEAVKAASEEF